tara:strand:+ start:850 stop:1263 length:414 start_codon:yes stop_codon:yes gene_type:complete
MKDILNPFYGSAIRNDTGYSEEKIINILKSASENGRLEMISFPGSKFAFGVFKGQIKMACRDLLKIKRKNPEQYKRMVLQIKYYAMENVLKETTTNPKDMVFGLHKEEHDDMMWDAVAYRVVEHLEEDKPLFRKEEK